MRPLTGAAMGDGRPPIESEPVPSPRAPWILRFVGGMAGLAVVTLLVFAVTRIVPGGPIERMMTEAMLSGGDRGGAVANRGVGGSVLSEAQLDQLREYYGFDKPIVISYVDWLGKVVRPMRDRVVNRLIRVDYLGNVSQPNCFL